MDGADPALLKVCFATRESGATSADDFIELQDSWQQQAVSSFSPVRTVVGAQQDFLVTDLSSTDNLVGWTMENCSVFAAPGNNASESKTVAYQALGFTSSTPADTFTLHANVSNGTWRFCQQPSATDAIWQEVTDQRLQLISQPTFWPLSGFASLEVPIQITGAADGDIIVMQTSSCGSVGSIALPIASGSVVSGPDCACLGPNDDKLFGYCSSEVGCTSPTCFNSRWVCGNEPNADDGGNDCIGPLCHDPSLGAGSTSGSGSGSGSGSSSGSGSGSSSSDGSGSGSGSGASSSSSARRLLTTGSSFDSFGLPISSLHDALAPTAIEQSHIHTDVAMTSISQLNVCFTTDESMRTQPAFVTIGEWTPRAMPDFNPQRTMSGAPQQLIVSGGIDGDLAYWTKGNCSTPELIPGSATTDLTTVYNVSSNKTIFALHTAASSGSWNLCYQVVDGIWQNVTRVKLNVAAPPTLFPLVGIAGSETHVSLSGSTQVTSACMPCHSERSDHMLVCRVTLLS